MYQLPRHSAVVLV
jgi:hypothetical protein